jgi:hypothetical protein
MVLLESSEPLDEVGSESAAWGTPMCAKVETNCLALEVGGRYRSAGGIQNGIREQARHGVVACVGFFSQQHTTTEPRTMTDKDKDEGECETILEHFSAMCYCPIAYAGDHPPILILFTSL